MQLAPEKLEWLFREQEERLELHELVLREGKLPLNVEGQVVILVSDGLSGTSNVLSAIKAIRKLKPERLIVATAAAPPYAWFDLHAEADMYLCLFEADPFGEVADWYEDFSRSSTEEEAQLLKGETATELIEV